MKRRRGGKGKGKQTRREERGGEALAKREQELKRWKEDEEEKMKEGKANQTRGGKEIRKKNR